MPKGPPPKLDYSKKNIEKESSFEPLISEQVSLQQSQIQQSKETSKDLPPVPASGNTVANGGAGDSHVNAEQQKAHDERHKALQFGAQTLFLHHNKITSFPARFSEKFLSLRVLYLNN